MATRIVVASEDDLDGDPAAETLRFATRGSEDETDLSKKNARKLWKRLALFIEHARNAERGQCYRLARTSAHRERNVGIPARAKPSGTPVSDRGRIPRTLPRSRRAD